MELFIVPIFHIFATMFMYFIHDGYGIVAICAVIAQLMLWKFLIKRQIEQFNQKALIRYAVEWGINIIYVLTAGKDLFNIKNGNNIDDIFTLLNSPTAMLYYSCNPLREFLDERAIHPSMFAKSVTLIISSIMVLTCVYLYTKHSPESK